MKIYLDDMRELPVWAVYGGWILVRTYEDVIACLETGRVAELSLDHDLGTKKTGYDVLLWIEEKVIEENFIPPKIYIHTMNPVGRKNMELKVIEIEERVNNG